MAIHRFSRLLTPNDAPVPEPLASFRTPIEQKHSLLQQHDPDNPDFAYASRVGTELVNLAGGLVIVYTRTDSPAYDKVWEEEADPTYFAGKHLKAYFKPEPLASQLTPWGVDSPNQTTIIFSRSDVFKTFGNRMLREGDIIEIPYNAAAKPKPDRYRVLNASDTGNFRYNWLYFSCVCENITGDVTIDIHHK